MEALDGLVQVLTPGTASNGEAIRNTVPPKPSIVVCLTVFCDVGVNMDMFPGGEVSTKIRRVYSVNSLGRDTLRAIED